jgi:hypothetical protein
LHIGGDRIIEDLYQHTFYINPRRANYFDSLLERKRQGQLLIWREAELIEKTAIMESIKAEQRETGGSMFSNRKQL